MIKNKGENMSDKKVPSMIVNNSLPNIWVDNMRFGTRADGLCSISFSASTPDGNVEQIRMMSGPPQLRAFIDLICNKLDYYPVKKEPETPPIQKH